MKRLVVVPVVMIFLLAALVPAASADTPNVVFMGQGQSNALNLSVPLLNSLPTSILSGILGNLGALGKGITAGHTESTFEGLSNPSVNGLAIGLCGLLGQNLLSLPATGGTLPGTLPALGGLPNLGGLCSGQTQATSSSVGSHGSTTQTCADLNIAILDIKTACSQSYSTIDGGRPISQNNAGVAEINVALLPNVLGGLGLNSLLGSLGLGNVLGGALPAAPASRLPRTTSSAPSPTPCSRCSATPATSSRSASAPARPSCRTTARPRRRPRRQPARTSASSPTSSRSTWAQPTPR
ncbi:MAG: hypothetical protein E6G66_08590 [Actinobacteria bacterium]|nr:MAG: hypothetical protein E6G66_08590 [Actinomycetota bacterium]